MDGKELVEALRTAGNAALMTNHSTWAMLMNNAADEIERLRKEVARNTLHADWSKR